jgi:hypothetical protein
MKYLNILSLVLFLCLSRPAFAQPDYWADLVYFSGCPVNHIPKGITIPDSDKQARLILNAIIAGTPEEKLRLQFPDSLDIELKKLTDGNVIRRNNNHLELTIPVLTGERRKNLMDLVHKKVFELNIPLDSLLKPLEIALKDHPKLVFHFLWSRVMDDCWWNWYNSEFNSDQGPPSIAFIVFPPHPFQCGTNSDYSADNSQFALSWSYNLFDEFFTLPSTDSFYNLASGKPIPDKDRSFFKRYGLLDSNNTPKIYCYVEDGALDSICNLLKSKYITMVKGMFDYQDLSNEFHIPGDELFLVVSHEIAYEIFNLIHEQERSVYIPIIKENNPTPDFSVLVSWKLSRPLKTE